MDPQKCQNYFIVNEKKYYTGTEFKIKYMGDVVDAVFVCVHFSDTFGINIVYRLKHNGQQWHTPIPMFQKDFVCITGAVDIETKMPQTKHMRDRDIPGLALGWTWYIFLMAIVTIFKDNVGLWILISVIFFSWRAKKIKEEGTYIEW